jgi:hypothetical protein
MRTTSFAVDPESRLLDPAACHAITLDLARDAFLAVSDKGRELVPMFQFVFRRNRQVWLIETAWPDEYATVIGVNVLRAMVRKMKPDHYSMMSEVWRVTRTGPLDPEAPPPSQCDDRREGLLVATIAREGEHFNTMFPIERGGDGKRHLGPADVDSDYDSMGGRMAELYR